MNITIFDIIILVSATTILLICFSIYFKSPNLDSFIENTDKLTFVTLDTILKEAETGDLILMSGDTRGERVCKWFSGSVYSHVGILIKEDTDIYIWESDLGQHAKDGPRIIKFTDKLKNYKGSPYLLWRPLVCQSRPTIDTIMTIVNRYKDAQFDNRMLSWFFPFKFGEYFKDENKIFCSELVAITLQQLNILTQSSLPTTYSPQDFVNNIKGLNSNYSYLKGVYCKHNFCKS
jgi:hypothetical protein